MKAREAALEVLLQVTVKGRFLDDALDRVLGKLTDPRDRALASDIAYGVCRYWVRLEALRDQLLDRRLKAKDRDVGVVLCIGLYQLEYSRVASHAAVSETVALCGPMRKQWASGLVNALLRRFQREGGRLRERVDADPATRLAHPDWLLARLRAAWPEQWEDIATANNIQAPMTLRSNQQRHSRTDALESLAAAGIAAHATSYSPQGIALEQPMDVAALPGFSDGLLSVQDEAAQLCAGLLDVNPGSRFLDACSAPGGKLAHVLEASPGVHATALERDPSRSRRTASTLARLQLDARLLDTDARNVDAWWDGTPFDRVLLDVPCSATGVIRRHPDIKLHRTAGDLVALAAAQFELLEALWPVLARNARLLYATCSVMPEENAAVVSRFLERHGDAELIEPDVPWGAPAAAGRQILPGEAGMDGFYYALLAKR